MTNEYAFDNDTEYDERLLVPVEEDTFDRYGWEKMIHALPQQQVEVLVCLYLGFGPSEIVEILGLPNIVRYYNISTKLRRLYNEQKTECLGYN